MKLDNTFGGHGEGIFYDIPEKEYRAINAVSSSFVKESIKSLKHAHSMLTRDSKPKPAYELGRLIHMAILEPDRYKQDVIETDILTKTLKAYKDLKKEHLDKIILNKKETDMIHGIVEAIGTHTTAPKTIKEGQAEVTILVMHPTLKMPLKGRLDFLNEDKNYILDLKTAAQVSNPYFMNDACRYNYHVQAAFYLMLLNFLKSFGETYFLLAIEKEEPFDSILYEYGWESIGRGRDLIDEQLPKIKFAIENNEWPGFASEPLMLSLPRWGWGMDD